MSTSDFAKRLSADEFISEFRKACFWDMRPYRGELYMMTWDADGNEEEFFVGPARDEMKSEDYQTFLANLMNLVDTDEAKARKMIVV